MIKKGWSYPIEKIKVYKSKDGNVTKTYITTFDRNFVGKKMQNCYCSIAVDGIFDIRVGDRIKFDNIETVKIVQMYNPQSKKYYTMCQVKVDTIELVEEIDESQKEYETIEEIMSDSKNYADDLPF